jgi:hypothetical protein
MRLSIYSCLYVRKTDLALITQVKAKNETMETLSLLAFRAISRSSYRDNFPVHLLCDRSAPPNRTWQIREIIRPFFNAGRWHKRQGAAVAIELVQHVRTF